MASSLAEHASWKLMGWQSAVHSTPVFTSQVEWASTLMSPQAPSPA